MAPWKLKRGLILSCRLQVIPSQAFGATGIIWSSSLHGITLSYSSRLSWWKISSSPKTSQPGMQLKNSIIALTPHLLFKEVTLVALLPLKSIYNSWHEIYLVQLPSPLGETFFKYATGLPDSTLWRYLSGVLEDPILPLPNPPPVSRAQWFCRTVLFLTMPSVCFLGHGEQLEKHCNKLEVHSLIVSRRSQCLRKVKGPLGLHPSGVMRLCHLPPIQEDFFRLMTVRAIKY